MASPAPQLIPSERELLARLSFLCWSDRGHPDNTVVSREELISRLAYALWESRGRPEGYADRDWFEAEDYVRELIESEAAAVAS